MPDPARPCNPYIEALSWQTHQGCNALLDVLLGVEQYPGLSRLVEDQFDDHELHRCLDQYI